MAKKHNSDFGLGGFGGHGGMLDDGWVGASIGAVAQSAAAAGVRAFSSYAKWSEAIGAGVGLAAGAALYFTGNRESGKVAMAVAVSSGLVRVAESLMAKGTIGYPVIDQTQVLRGFGLATIDPTQAWNGANAQLVGPPQLVGTEGFGSNPGAQQARLEGGPAVSGLAGMYGATLFGGN